MKISPDSLLFVFAHFNDLLFESLSVFEQRNARVGSTLLFAHGDTGQSHEKEKSKTDGDFPRLNRCVGVGVAQHKISPGPKHPGQASDDEYAFVVAEPNRKNDRDCVEKDE